LRIIAVDTQEAFLAALEHCGIDLGFDLILADYTLPCFDGLSPAAADPSVGRRPLRRRSPRRKGGCRGRLGLRPGLGVPPTTLDSKIRALGINKHRYQTT
jgi:hypothetical protein